VATNPVPGNPFALEARIVLVLALFLVLDPAENEYEKENEHD
jgi:hypothetical protein